MASERAALPPPQPMRVSTPSGSLVVQPAQQGAHQQHNTALAVAALHRLRADGLTIPDEAIAQGVSSLRWPVRIEVVRRRPLVIVDAAHNWASARALLATLAEVRVTGPRVLLFATSRDKDMTGLLRLLLPRFDAVVLTRFVKNPRACPVDVLHGLAAEIWAAPVHSAPDPAAAWALARQITGEDGLLCVAGSFFLAAEIKSLLQ